IPTVLTKDFNVRETSAGTWLTFEEANNEATFSLEELRDTYAIGGVDLSATTDLTAAAILVMRPDGQMYALVQGFMPGDTIEQRSQEDKVPYDRWVERGLITPCPGNRIDHRYVTDWFARLRDEYGISTYWVGYDSWNSPAWVEDMETRLGYQNKVNLLPVIMGAKTLSAPMKLLRADLAAKRINYNRNPLLLWALTNMAVEVDKNENIRPVKTAGRRRRIDPAVALILAYTVLQLTPEDYRALVDGGEPVEHRHWLQRLFGRFIGRRAGLTQVKVMAGYTPVFTPWGERPYEADVVRAAVDAIARNAAKLKAKHIRRVNGEVVHVKNSDIERVLSLRPNPKMSAYDLLYKLVTTLMMDNN